ncbi:MAG: magnesium chelatase [Phycisphaeraceae bacterium]|nr:magnesium chelatase [Phycisphaeraceae bacterium]
MTNHPSPATLAQLRSTGYRYRSVKQELRENLIARLRAGDEIFPGVLGYRETVLPQVIHAILSRHDMLFLGLRGQAKTRMLRMLPQFLDEWIPVLADAEIPDDPLHPVTTLGRRSVAEKGDDAPLRWMHRDERYHEKLATPDVTIADLIGEVDIVKYAEGRYLADESTMHFGLIPRTNRGIFAINELPDLAPRIQVGLFNVLEERDIQIRGYPIRLSLDVCLAFSANPEDYTNRGRIVTPLKDRIGSVIRTHYPQTTEEAMAVTSLNAWVQRQAAEGGDPTPDVIVPEFMHRIIETAVARARSSTHINQSSGVSVRASVACLENMVSSAERRGILAGEKSVVPRMCDLAHLVASTRGKIELMMAEDGSAGEDRVVLSLIGEAVKDVFNHYAQVEEFEAIIETFEDGLTLVINDQSPAGEIIENAKLVKGLKDAAVEMAQRMELDPKNPQMLACAVEFILEGLFVNNRLSKKETSHGIGYRR